MAAQAVQLDYMPRVKILHTSASHRGQIYVPIANWALMIGCVGLVIGFQTSSNLAAAYGLAVTMTMAITSLLLGAVAFRVWKWKRWVSLTMTGLLLCVDLPFLIANDAKLEDGKVVGDPTEGALLVLAHKAGLSIEELLQTLREERDKYHVEGDTNAPSTDDASA